MLRLMVALHVAHLVLVIQLYLRAAWQLASVILSIQIYLGTARQSVCLILVDQVYLKAVEQSARLVLTTQLVRDRLIVSLFNSSYPTAIASNSAISLSGLDMSGILE